ncbi:MAG: gfo/Idh/MocA family oxidoreductase [Puniceicoccaceae bacterium]|nr:MAG: gfo/Idh/MocA family oxidoreductase [Puniceicoccaceae bacterium]
MNRRSFIIKTAAAAAFASTYNLLPARSLGANERVNIAVIGLQHKGRSLVDSFMAIPDVRVVALCDVDSKALDQAAEGVPNVKKVRDYRRLLEMNALDAIVIVTPNHWHAAMTVAACQAGKHVYVEKPVSHCIWEGQQMCAAREKYQRIIQAGTQHLSCPSIIECGRDIRAGVYGKVRWAHCFKINLRQSVGLRKSPMPIPDHIDYNLWAGPTPMTPIYRERFHYDWHWDLRWGAGEMGNWGVHYTSDLCDMLGWSSMPDSVMSTGGRFLWDDAADAPNMLLSAMKHQGIPLTVEIRNLTIAKDSNVMPAHMGMRNGVIIMCENGLLKLSRGGGRAFTPDGKEVIKTYEGNGGADHPANFIAAIRADKHSMLNAPIEGGHISSGICHLANISYRLGTQASPDEVRSRMRHYENLRATMDAHLHQLEANEVDWSRLKLGPQLSFDPATETFTGNDATEANQFLRYEMRREFAVPDQV